MNKRHSIENSQLSAYKRRLIREADLPGTAAERKAIRLAKQAEKYLRTTDKRERRAEDQAIRTARNLLEREEKKANRKRKNNCVDGFTTVKEHKNKKGVTVKAHKRKCGPRGPKAERSVSAPAARASAKPPRAKKQTNKRALTKEEEKALLEQVPGIRLHRGPITAHNKRSRIVYNDPTMRGKTTIEPVKDYLNRWKGVSMRIKVPGRKTQAEQIAEKSLETPPPPVVPFAAPLGEPMPPAPFIESRVATPVREAIPSILSVEPAVPVMAAPVPVRRAPRKITPTVVAPPAAGPIVEMQSASPKKATHAKELLEDVSVPGYVGNYKKKSAGVDPLAGYSRDEDFLDSEEYEDDYAGEPPEEAFLANYNPKIYDPFINKRSQAYKDKRARVGSGKRRFRNVRMRGRGKGLGVPFASPRF